jgi:hypothetical protein
MSTASILRVGHAFGEGQARETPTPARLCLVLRQRGSCAHVRARQA